ncbi:MAG: DUF3754 domain-containing protein, partial [Synergistales bacterium]|nr:DUF3754 domain-containing protein [Synergistales bacterium]
TVVVLVTRLGAVLGLVAALVLFYLGVGRERPVIDSARLLALGTGMGALGCFLFKQWSNYKNRTIRFMKLLTENLYFRNLDNNRGVLHALVDEAEEEEVKEAVLAYFFLLTAEKRLTAEELDNAVESWFQDKWSERLDFEVEDGLGKLVRLGLADEKDGTFSVLPLPRAKERIDYLWDNFFDYNHALETAQAAVGRDVEDQNAGVRQPFPCPGAVMPPFSGRSVRLLRLIFLRVKRFEFFPKSLVLRRIISGENHPVHIRLVE